jgi:hypothetical protein
VGIINLQSKLENNTREVWQQQLEPKLSSHFLTETSKILTQRNHRSPV